MIMKKVTLGNFRKYNFEMTLESQLEDLRDAKQYDGMVQLLSEHLNSLINTIKYFGDGDMAKKILKQYFELVQFICLDNNGRGNYYYALNREIQKEIRSYYPSSDRCIELMVCCIELVESHYGA